MGATLAHAQRGFFAGHHNGVAANHQIGRSHADPGGADFVLVRGNEDMAPGGTALLRQTACVLGDNALAFQVCCHTQQLTDGDNTGPPHAGHDDAPGPTIQ